LKILTFRLFGTNNILFGHTLSTEDLDLKKIIYNFVLKVITKKVSSGRHALVISTVLVKKSFIRVKIVSIVNLGYEKQKQGEKN